MIGVIDYEAGNIASVSNALGTINAEFVVTNDIATLKKCRGIILPGVGAAGGAMASLQQYTLDTFLPTVTVPFLGICLGMQLLYENSEEGSTKCLAVLKGTVRKFDGRTSKVPHMGWNLVEQRSPNPLMKGVPEKEHFYFANSYYSPVDGQATAVTSDGVEFAAAIRKDNFLGVQFHPEKSGTIGLNLLRNFVDLCR